MLLSDSFVLTQQAKLFWFQFHFAERTCPPDSLAALKVLAGLWSVFMCHVAELLRWLTSRLLLGADGEP